MNRDQRDEGLRRAFEELREEDRRALPPIERVLRRPRTPPDARTRSWRPAWVVMAGLGLVAIVAGFLLARRAPTPMPEGAEVALAAWRSPTDALLRTPGWELARDLPRVGGFELPGLGALEARPTNDDAKPLNGRKETNR